MIVYGAVRAGVCHIGGEDVAACPTFLPGCVMCLCYSVGVTGVFMCVVFRAWNAGS